MRVIPGVLSWFTVIFIVIFAPKPLSAQNNETPRNKHAWWIEPYASLGYTSDIVETAATNQGYIVRYYSNTDINLDPDLTIDNVESIYGSGSGAGLIITHGNPTGHAIELYEYTPAGESERDAQWDEYMNEGYGGKIYRGSVPGQSHHIGVLYNGGVSQRSHCDSAIIDNIT
jgi:hypothetical protein